MLNPFTLCIVTFDPPISNRRGIIIGLLSTKKLSIPIQDGRAIGISLGGWGTRLNPKRKLAHPVCYRNKF